MRRVFLKALSGRQRFIVSEWENKRYKLKRLKEFCMCWFFQLMEKIDSKIAKTMSNSFEPIISHNGNVSHLIYSKRARTKHTFSSLKVPPWTGDSEYQHNIDYSIKGSVCIFCSLMVNENPTPFFSDGAILTKKLLITISVCISAIILVTVCLTVPAVLWTKNARPTTTTALTTGSVIGEERIGYRVYIE